MTLYNEFFRRMLTGWHIKDGAPQADAVLTEMDYPSLLSMLPYRHFDPETGMFINSTTVGFVLECTPLIGANESIVDALDNFCAISFPVKAPLSVLLLGE